MTDLSQLLTEAKEWADCTDNGGCVEHQFDSGADLVRRLAAALSSRSPEDEAEHFIQAAIDRAPEPLRRLGEYLSEILDDDQWKTAEKMLLGGAAASRAA